jgi:DNA topoisomerase-1
LQQAASSKLGFNASRTMQVAQKLYEGIDIGGETVGLITYMRTDGVQMAPEAIDEAREAIATRFGERYVPEKARHYATKAKNAQEAHEAIRPTGFERAPDDLKKYLDADQLQALRPDLETRHCQPDGLRRDRTHHGRDHRFEGRQDSRLRATGSVIRFDGFIAAYTDAKEDGEQSDGDDDDDARLPEINAREALAREKINATQHFTEPPPRYSEASLIKKMEELGIGRPSTYASTLATLRDREYVVIDKRKLIPEAKGRLVIAFLENFFERYVEFGFTADLEEKLDRISAGELAWKDVLREFWTQFHAHIDDTKELRVSQVLDALNEALAPLVFPVREDGSNPRICPTCGTGNLSLKLGKYGAFVGCSNYPDCNFTRQLSADQDCGRRGVAVERAEGSGQGPAHGRADHLAHRAVRPLCPARRRQGSQARACPRAGRSRTIDHEKAMALLSLPRDIGQHPESGKMISAGSAAMARSCCMTAPMPISRAWRTSFPSASTAQ